MTPSRPARRALVLGATLAAALPLAACGGGSDDSGSSDGEITGTITVSAAASLTETFTELATQFEAEHDGVEVELVFDSSGTLADQAVEGAPGDVLATADTASMDRAADAQASDPEIFATNELVLVTPAANPAGVTGIDSLNSGDVTYVVCVETAPCGVLAEEALDDAGITTEPASLEKDVKATLTKVTEDEADAGLVYHTDALAEGDTITEFELPEPLATDYPITLLDQSENTATAQAFIDFVLSEAGTEVFTAAGFGTPWSTRDAVATSRVSPLGRAPALLWVPAAVAVVFLGLPLLALIVATPWSDFFADLREPAVLEALWISALTSGWTVLLCLLFGTPLAWLLARVDFRGRAAVRVLVTVPLVLPPVVAGVALLAALGRSGLVGAPLRDLTGFSLPFTTAAVVVAHTFVSLPFYVISVEGALRSAGEAYDEVAAVLGASRWYTFRRITLPLALPGVVAGAVLAWARSLGEFGATVTFAGNYPGVTQTMPSRIYAVYLADAEAARTLAMILLLASVGALALLRNRWLSTEAP